MENNETPTAEKINCLFIQKSAFSRPKFLLKHTVFVCTMTASAKKNLHQMIPKDEGCVCCMVS